MKKPYKKMPTIELEKVYLRTIEKKDYLDMYDYGRRKNVVHFLSWGPFSSEKEALMSIKQIFLPRLKDRLPVGYAIVDKSNNKMIGTIDFHSKNKHENGAEIGYVLHPDYWNQGIMTEAVLSLIKIGFEYLNYDFIRVKHLKLNEASQKVIMKCGFKYLNSEPYLFEKKDQILKDDMLSYEITKETYYGN